LIEKVTRCLDNGEDCVKLIEELIRDCNDRREVGKEIVNKAKDVVHRLWLKSDGKHRCKLLRILSKYVSKRWAMSALHANIYRHFAKCGIDWEGKLTRPKIIEKIEGILREKFGWDEHVMCEAMWRYIGVDVNELRAHGVDPCAWLEDLEELSDLTDPYWFGLQVTDFFFEKRKSIDYNELEVATTSTVGVIYFLSILRIIKTPHLYIRRTRIPTAKHVQEAYHLTFTINGIKWPWIINPSRDEFEKILNTFDDEKFLKFLAGALDGDGTIICNRKETGSSVYQVIVAITAGKNSNKIYLNILLSHIAARFGVTGKIYTWGHESALMFTGKNAIKLLSRLVRFIRHPIKKIKAMLILAFFKGKIDAKTFERLYEMVKYKVGEPDVKRDRALGVTIQAAPQTHTHGEQTITNAKQRIIGSPTNLALSQINGVEVMYTHHDWTIPSKGITG
jgi:hypothetical protein